MTQAIHNQSDSSQQLFPACYFPPVHWVTAWQQATNPVIDAWMWYQKQQLSSRTWIKGSEQPLALHIPVERRSKKAPIMEKKVSYQENWRQRHWRSIQNYYRNSPYFTFYEEDLAAFFSQDHEHLIDWISASIRLSLGWVGISTTVEFTESFVTMCEEGNDWRRSFSGKLEVPDQYTPASYTQVYGEFTPGLSILDLVLTTGPESLLVIKRGIISNHSLNKY